jgi:hypothetical protein
MATCFWSHFLIAEMTNPKAPDPSSYCNLYLESISGQMDVQTILLASKACDLRPIQSSDRLRFMRIMAVKLRSREHHGTFKTRNFQNTELSKHGSSETNRSGNRDEGFKEYFLYTVLPTLYLEHLRSE